MLLQTATHFSLESFRQKSANKKLVLVYPWINYQSQFLTSFLDNAKEGILYYRINGEQTPLHTWLSGLLEAFHVVLGNFDMRLREALPNANPVEMAEALASALGGYNQGSSILFLDNLEHVAINADFNRFIRTLVGALPDGVQIAFSSRLLTYQPWYDMVARGEAIVLGTDQRKDDMMFTVENTPRPQLEVYGFGRGHALVNGMPITNWDGALPRNLFFFFMDHPLVTRDEIFETFWPDLSVKEATNVFHVTKRKITERISMKISEDGSYELTQYNSGFYMPSDKVVRHYEVGDFQEAVDKALVASSEKEEMALLSRAIDIYKAPFLQTIEMKWVQERRNTLRQLYAQALIGMGRIYNRRSESQRAIGFFTRALKETPEREDIHRQVMSLYQGMGMLDDAVLQYRKLEQFLRDTLRIAPARETLELYNQISDSRN